MALTRNELDAAGCDEPGCTRDHSTIVLGSACHPAAPVRVAYAKATGELRLWCSVCEGLLIEIMVARRLDS